MRVRCTNRLIRLLALTLVSAGSLTAHGLGFRLVAGDRDAKLLAATGHAYLPSLTDVLLAAAACALVLLCAIGASAARGGRRALAPPTIAALAAPVAFAVQEHVERVAAGQDAWLTALAPTFLVGLALQLPFALVGLWLARRLTAVALAVGKVLRHVAHPLRARPCTIASTACELAPRPTHGAPAMRRGPPRGI